MGRRASKRVRPSLNPPGKRGEAAHEPSIEWRLPKTRKCEAPKCGNDFVVSSANGNAKTCSPECSLKFELAWRKQYWIDCKGDPKKHEKIKARLNARYHCNYRPVMRPCIVCGEKFRVLRSALTCSTECGRVRGSAKQRQRYYANLESKREYKRNWRAKRRALVIKQCAYAECGKEFTPTGLGRFCSSACREKSMKASKLASDVRYRAKNRSKLRAANRIYYAKKRRRRHAA
jgi:predicted nucleic acid-binding Zn ribbon protein